MKKIRITENELVSLIEKLVKENLGDGVGQIFPLMGAPSEKYKDLLEKDDIEETDGEEEQLNLNVTDQPGSDDEDAWMESIVDRLKTRLTEAEGKGCAESEGGSGCIKKRGNGWVILNNKKGGVWRKCTSEKDCQEQLDAFHANK
tara:strand:- start:338 stop:772 length:435 start_codon:yes stop_codon:yes gene_type:complete